MTDRESLYAAILANPDEDTPRLMYADWLDEFEGAVVCPKCKGKGVVYYTTNPGCDDEGEYKDRCPACTGVGTLPNPRGEFIRVQCRIAALERHKADLLNDDVDWSRCSTESAVAASWCPNCGDCSCPDREERMDDPACPLHAPDSPHCCHETTDRKLEALRRRERELHPQGSSEDVAFARLVMPDLRPGERPPVAWEYRRGFVDSVRCPLAVWMGGVCERCGAGWYDRTPAGDPVVCADCHGSGRTGGIAGKVCGAHPVTACVLTDREPMGRDMDDRRPPYEWMGTSHPGNLASPHHRYYLPFDLWNHDLISGVARDGKRQARHFRTPALAHAALSRACVRFARNLSGLPPLG